MCTVSFVATNDSVIITSNRDEKTIRPSAIPPKSYTVNGQNLIFPKDPKAGGTWFVTKDDGTVLVLLNGAAEKHEVQLSYRKSRGLIVLEMISSASPKDFWIEIDLESIEPFTLVLFQNQELFQLRWDGNNKQTLTLDSNKNHIWSSSTLYPSLVREQRADWFYTFMSETDVISKEKLYDFHRYTQEGNEENGLVINRNNEMKTLSITQAVVHQNKVSILHYDLVEQLDFSTSFITV
ncbi:hypothetical protein FVB9288_00354 [Flavobacterium sp. CECT 9288]|uniref:NRDE family protein n=1 Tax=Flavobacterium sp. CECT 9288 TaxID=2845819 RepID=UPI001E5CA489|nr:NRDE family protein [Flavobacterium sp. CECT 9288]CAH0334748.1 hypothetical protein FVB9288_00354 [Flavobacterium sp. CECT 9288]